MIAQLENAGLSFVGKDKTGQRMEVCICSGGTFFVICIMIIQNKSGGSELVFVY